MIVGHVSLWHNVACVYGYVRRFVLLCWIFFVDLGIELKLVDGSDEGDDPNDIDDDEEEPEDSDSDDDDDDDDDEKGDSDKETKAKE